MKRGECAIGDEPWLGKSTIRRRVMLRVFGKVAKAPNVVEVQTNIFLRRFMD